MALKYRTYSQLMASVEQDLNTYADEGFIDRGNYIKVAKKINKQLGVKIQNENEIILEVKDYKAQLPADFEFLQLALACHTSYWKRPTFHGTQTESFSTEECVDVENFQPKTCSTECGQQLWIIKKEHGKVEKITNFDRLQLTKKSAPYCSQDCLNLRFKSSNVMNIEGDEATFSFREGEVYINYISDMRDEEGNLLVLDHDLVNDYYEYAIKNRIIENMKINKAGDFIQDIQILSERERQAKIMALSVSNMPEYDEILKVYDANRKRFYNKYIRYFDDHQNGHYNL